MCPALQEDDLVPADDVRYFAATSFLPASTVHVKCFPHGRHVRAFLQHPKEYTATVHAFLVCGRLAPGNLPFFLNRH